MKPCLKQMALTLLLLFCAAFMWAQEPPTIAVLDFELEEVSEKDMKVIVSLLSSALFQTGKFTVIESTKRDTVLEELKFSASGLTDSDSIREIGRLLSAEGLVVGNIGKVGSRFILSIKLLETETAKTMASADGRYPDIDKLLDGLETLAAQLAGVDAPVPVAETAAPVKTGEEPEAAEAKTETLPLTEEKPPRTKRIRSGRPMLWLGVGGATLVGGGVLAFTTVKFKQNTVDVLYDDYLTGGDEPFTMMPIEEQEVYFANLYDSYEAKHNQFLIRSLSSLGLMGIGAGLSTLGVFQLIGTKPDDVSVSVGADIDRISLSFQVRR